MRYTLFKMSSRLELVPLASKIEQPLNKLKKCKVGIIYGYNGEGYKGSQYLKSFPTVEGELLKALINSNLISEIYLDDPKKAGLSRGSRTDKGVHARMQLACFKLMIDESPSGAEPDYTKLQKTCDLLVDKINSNLPCSVKIFKIFPTMRSFYPRFDCNMRHYRYLIPYSFLFENNNFTKNMEKLKDLINEFVGTHKFHNFTVKGDPKDPKVFRTITKMDIKMIDLLDNEHYNISNIIDYENEKNKFFVQFEIVGKSFMMYHIRKMMTIIIIMCRYAYNKELLQMLFMDYIIKIIPAPQFALYLHYMDFECYNRRIDQIKSKKQKICLHDNEDNMDTFEQANIVNKIIRNEIVSSEFETWNYFELEKFMKKNPFFNPSLRLP